VDSPRLQDPEGADCLIDPWSAADDVTCQDKTAYNTTAINLYCITSLPMGCLNLQWIEMYVYFSDVPNALCARQGKHARERVCIQRHRISRPRNTLISPEPSPPARAGERLPPRDGRITWFTVTSYAGTVYASLTHALLSKAGRGGGLAQ